MNNELKEKIEKMESELAQMKKQLKETKDDGFKDGDEVWILEGASIFAFLWDEDSDYDRRLLNQGVVFKTRQEANNEARRRELCTTLKRIIKEKNDGWKPDWKELKQDKHYIYIDTEEDKFGIGWFSKTKNFHDNYYIKSFRTGEEILEENKELLEELKGLGWI